MKTKIFFLLLVAGLVCAPAVWAWDVEPDPETGLYDKFYDRPTHFPEWTQPVEWPNTMYMFCDVRMGSAEGERVLSYEVAVYDQNDVLRSCDRSLAEQDHYCVLTIKGEDGVDTFHFQVVYGDNFAKPTIADIDGVTVPFETNETIGSKEEPFLLIIDNTPTGMENVQKSGMTGSKVLRDGVLLIEREGRTYDMTGREWNSEK